MKKKVLFVPQNREHILNMNPVIETLRKEEITCHYLDTNPVFFQDLTYPKNIKVISAFRKNLLSKSFYNISYIRRAGLIFGLKDLASEIVEDYDLIVIGNDGSVQRQLVYYAKKKNKPCAMILDGLISAPVLFDFGDVWKKSDNKPQDAIACLKKKTILFTSKLFSRTAISPYLPSIIGCGDLDHIYTIGKYSKDEISKYALKSTKVFNTGLPRMSVYFKEKEVSFLPKKPKSVCFITSAYKWHGLSSYHNYQINDILLIKKCLDEISTNESIPFYIKLHPRERVEDYIQFKKTEGLFLVENESFTDTMNNYRVLLSNLSTCIIEGLNNGIEVASLMINFPYWKVKKGFLKSSNIVKLFHEKDLKRYLSEQLEHPSVLYKEECENHFLSSGTIQSKNIISNHLKSLLQ
ncbi:MAG: hypothetical protein AB3N18_01550 [Allomuricauda sp.]